MHEMSLCEGIIQILEEQAKTQNFHRVKTIWLEIGALAGVEITALEFSYDVVSRNTLADNSELKIINVAATAECIGCGQSFTIDQRYLPCPYCGDYQLQITSGEQMRIRELEVE